MRCRNFYSITVIFGILTASSSAIAGSNRPLVVATTAELVAAMSPKNAGRTILIKAGIYYPKAPLLVPSRAKVRGEGVMKLDSAGIPIGFVSGTETVIRPVANPSPIGPSNPYFGKWILQLSDGASIQGITIDNKLEGSNSLRIFAVGRELVRAGIVECEIHGPGGPGVVDGRPVGRPIYISSGSLPSPGVDPQGDPTVEVHLKRSIVDAHGGDQALFVINHETRGQVNFFLSNNHVRNGFEGLDAVAAASRNEQPVNGASMTIFSRRNVYQGFGDLDFSIGLSANGGSPAPAPGTTVGASDNQLRLSSFQDTIQDVTVGVFARAAQRLDAEQEESNDNHTDLILIGTDIATVGFVLPPPDPPTLVPASDLVLCATSPFGDFPAGSGNVLRVLGRQLLGSGQRDNVYGLRCDLNPDDNGNSLEFVGSLNSWLRTNESIDPAPAEEFFYNH